MALATDIPTSDNPKSNKALIHAAIVIAAGVVATTLAQTQLLPRIPLQNLLKNELHVDRSTNAAFFFWIGIAWYFKPFAGIITDAFPLFRSRRKSYILVSTILAAINWFALIVTPHEYNKLLWALLVLNTFLMILSTVIGGYMVEVAQQVSGSGRLTAVRQFVQQASYIISGPTAGYLASIAFGWTAAACGGIMLLTVPVAIFFLHEHRVRVNSQELLNNARKQLVKIGTAKTMWAATGLMALFYIAPGLQTALFYKQQNDLHMDTQAQGFLNLVSGIGGVIAALAYAYICRRYNLRFLLIWCMILGTAGNLVYLFYTSPFNAKVIEGLNGLGYTFAELALMDLAVRATPAGSEGLGFSLMISVRNLALFGTDWFGAKLLDDYHVSFNSLVVANGATSLITVPLVFLLPLAIVGRKDAQAPEETPALKTATE